MTQFNAHVDSQLQSSHATRRTEIGVLCSSIDLLGQEQDGWAKKENESMVAVASSAVTNDERARNLGVDSEAREAQANFEECVERECGSLFLCCGHIGTFEFFNKN